MKRSPAPAHRSSESLRLGLPTPVWLLGWVSLFTDMASEMIYPLLPLFLTRVLGAGAMSLGVIEGAAEAANSVLKVISGRLADRWRASRKLVLAGYSISGAVRPLMAIATSWPHVLAIRFSDRLGKGIRGAPRDAMLAGFATTQTRGRVFGFQRAMDHAGAVAGPLIAAAFLYFYPGAYRTLFGLAIIPAIVVVLIILRVPDANPEVKREERGAKSGERKPDRGPGIPALGSSFYRAMSVILLFSLGNASDAFLLLRLGDLGVAPFWIPLLWSMLHVVKVVSSIVGGALSDRTGRRTIIAAGWIVYALVYAGFGAIDSRPLVIAIFRAYGLYFGLTEGAEKAWVADLVPAGARGTAFGIYNGVLGAGTLAASLLSGAIWTRVSPHAAFLTGSGLALAATGLLYLMFSHAKDPRHQR